jgi:hypothetical protein
MSQMLDLSGLPEEFVKLLNDCVQSAKRQGVDQPTDRESLLAWRERLFTWVRSHDSKATYVDDSRETIYAERGL